MAFVFKLECSVYSRNNTVCLDTIMLFGLEGKVQYARCIMMLHHAFPTSSVIRTDVC